MEWTATYIRMWFFPRNAIPPSIYNTHIHDVIKVGALSRDYTNEADRPVVDQCYFQRLYEFGLQSGASATAGIWTMFFEGGLVTDRHFRFRGDATDFAIDDCAMLRTGLLF